MKRKQFPMHRNASAQWVCLKSAFAFLASAALSAPYPGMAQTAPARQPFGIYGRANVHGCVVHPNQFAGEGINTNADECISNNITAILDNAATSGVATFVQWDDVCPLVGPTNSIVGTTNWNIFDDIFNSVAQWNTDHSNSPPKTIQLGLQAGFDTPQWVLNQLGFCDPMFLTNGDFDPGNAPTNCGCATFVSGEGTLITNSNKLLPLPWNPIYTNEWANFVQAVAQKYGSNPLLVTVIVAGPTADSSEMILPNAQNDPTNWVKWNPLFSLTFPTNYQNSDLAFIEAWERAIDMFGQAFSNTTLAVTTGNGFPNFVYTNSPGKKIVAYPTYTVPPGFAWPPGSAVTNDLPNIMDAAAETTILAYFADPTHGGNNAKAVQEDGLKAGEIDDKPLGGQDLGSHGIKWLAQSSASGSATLPGTTNVLSRILSGLQFDNSFVDELVKEGCNLADNCTNDDVPLPEQACYNVWEVYFDGTPVGASYGTNVTNYTFPMNYVQIYSDDIVYANTNIGGSIVVDGFGVSNYTTVQTLFNQASNQIFQIAEAPLYIQEAGYAIQVSWPAAASPFQLQFNGDLSMTNGWKTNANTSTPVLTNGFYQVSINTSSVARFYRLALP